MHILGNIEWSSVQPPVLTWSLLGACVLGTVGKGYIGKKNVVQGPESLAGPGESGSSVCAAVVRVTWRRGGVPG